MATHEHIPDLDVEELLFSGVLQGSPELYQGLLARVENVDVKNSSKRTLLHMAVRVGRYDWVERLLARGADPLIRDRNNSTVLEVAEEMEAKNPVEERKNISRILRCVQEREAARRGTLNGSEAAAVREGCTDTATEIHPVLKEVLSIMSTLSKEMCALSGSVEKLRQEVAFQQNTLSQKVSQEVALQRDALSQDISLLTGVVQEMRTSMKGDIDEVKVGLTSRDTLLEKLEVSVTSLAEKCDPLKKPLNEMSGKPKEARGESAVVSELPLRKVPSIGANNKEEIRTRCIEAMMSKTVLFRANDTCHSDLRCSYMQLYSLSPLTSCILRYLQFQQELQIVINCESSYIGKIKNKFRDLSGIECDGFRFHKFADFKMKALYLGGFDKSHIGRDFYRDLAESLAQMAVFLAFKNDGRPFVSGDKKQCDQYNRAIEEIQNDWSSEEDIDDSINSWLRSKCQLVREVCMISAVPAMISYYGSAVGILRARRKMRSLTIFYEEHVMPTLLRLAEESTLR